MSVWLFGLVIGHDSRFFGERFAHETARVLAASGVPSFICKDDTPTPVIAYEIMRRVTDGAINFTASHNPSEYNGIKFSTAWGGPALPEVTADIERRAKIDGLRLLRTPMGLAFARRVEPRWRPSRAGSGRNPRTH